MNINDNKLHQENYFSCVGNTKSKQNKQNSDHFAYITKQNAIKKYDLERYSLNVHFTGKIH